MRKATFKAMRAAAKRSFERSAEIYKRYVGTFPLDVEYKFYFQKSGANWLYKEGVITRENTSLVVVTCFGQVMDPAEF